MLTYVDLRTAPPCCLQEALSKAAGKKSKTPVQLDLGDMLAALEKQQQAMKARQLTNTKPLSYTGAHGSPLCPARAKHRKPRPSPLWANGVASFQAPVA